MKRFAEILGAVMIVVAVPGDVASAQVFFNDRGAFQAAAGPLNLQSFDGPNVVQETFTFTGFSVTETNGVNLLTTSTGLLTAAITHGTNALWYDDNENSRATFQFTAPIQAFGLDVTSELSGLMSILGGVNTSFALSPNTPRFFGVILVGGFSTVTFDMQGGPNVGFDFLEFSAAAAPATVPEPSTYALLAAGLLAIGAMGRRRRTA